MEKDPELTSAALSDGCRFTSASASHIDPGAPWRNGCIESFNGRLRDDLLNGEVFDTLLEAKTLTEVWCIDSAALRTEKQDPIGLRSHMHQLARTNHTDWHYKLGRHTRRCSRPT